MAALTKGFNGGLWAIRLVFAVVVAELAIVGGTVVGCFMEDIIKELESPTPVAIESIATPIPDIVEPPNNNLRDAGIVVGVVVLAAIFAKLYQVTSKK